MGSYFGRIDIANGSYYNFTPLYEVKDDGFEQLNEGDYRRILPESEKRNIYFSYNPHSNDAVDFMTGYFLEDVPIIYDFETSELEDNIDKQGYLNQTGYRIRTLDEYDRGAIKSTSDIGLYLLLTEDKISGSPYNTSIIDIGTDCIADDTQVMIKLKDEDVILGPYEVSYRLLDQTYIVSIKPEEHQYVLSGYELGDCNSVMFNTVDFGSITYVQPKNTAAKKYVDIINDKILLESFKNSVSNDFLCDGKLDLSKIDDIAEAFKKSEVMVADKAIRDNRLNRIKTMLEISGDLDASYRNVSEKLGSVLGDLISKYDDKDSDDSIVNTIIEANPDLLNRIPDYNYTINKIAELKLEEERIQEDLIAHKGELDSVKNLEPGVHAEFEELGDVKAELDNAKKERDDVEARVGELKNEYAQYKSYDKLEQKVSELTAEEKLLNSRNDQLRRETGELSTRLSDVTINIEKKLSEMPIDGLVANLLMESSSSWKKTREQEYYEEIVESYSTLDMVDKTSDEMVEYMYQRIKEVRPLYDKNTVTNITTCIFQNFLTVFSGDPGCGKTSICNIVGQALGLDKISTQTSQLISRYVPVSVERGWTSKRDFIGYYNPLTKTFDKNNKRIYEALQVADIEERTHTNNLPMIILLDEANLSPMEYYWADFMNVCDDLEVSNEINIGEDQIFNIPETLHFVATINNDHTTETLSPRLIDRAAVITLPKISLGEKGTSYNTGVLNIDDIDIVSWNTIKETYIKPEKVEFELPGSAKKIYENVIKPQLKSRQFYISPRTELAIIKYCSVASRLFDSDADSAKRDPSIIALDYAISQKVLPKINGYGEDYCDWLKELMKKCEDGYLMRSKELLGDIISKGEANMSYYQFFA